MMYRERPAVPPAVCVGGLDLAHLGGGTQRQYAVGLQRTVYAKSGCGRSGIKVDVDAGTQTAEGAMQIRRWSVRREGCVATYRTSTLSTFKL